MGSYFHCLLSLRRPSGKRRHREQNISLRRVYPSQLSIFHDHLTFFHSINPKEDINVACFSWTILISIRLRMNYDNGSDVGDVIFRQYRGTMEQKIRTPFTAFLWRQKKYDTRPSEKVWKKSKEYFFVKKI